MSPRPAPRVVIVSAAAVLAAALPSSAAAEDWFATIDETRTTQLCKSPATACALGVVMAKATALDTVTLGPGTYDLADVNAGAAVGSEPGRLVIPPRVTVFGNPDSAPPTIRLDTATDQPAVRVGAGGELRWAKVERTGSATAPAVLAIGAQTPDLPSLVDHVTVTSTGAAAGLTTVGVVNVRNSLVSHTGVAGTGAIDLDVSATANAATPQPRLVGVTALAAGGADALRVHADGDAAQQASITNTVLAGGVALVATRTGGGAPGTVTLNARNFAYPGPAPAVTGPATLAATATPVAFVPAMLDSGSLPVAGSALVDAGVDLEPAVRGATDLAGGKRVTGAAPDIGALERQDGTTPGTGTPIDAPLPPITDDWATISGGDGFGDLPDTLEPWVTIVSNVKKLSRTKLSGKSGLTLKVTTDEPATAKVELVVKTKSKGKTVERVLGTATAKATAAGEISMKLKVRKTKLPKKGTKATLRVTLTDGAGNIGRASSSTTLS